MSEAMTETVKRYAGLDGREYVALDDYARLEQECEDAKCQAELMQRAAEAIREERDAALKQVEGLLADKAAIDLLDQYIVTAEHPVTGKTAICADSGTLRDCMEAALSAKP